MGNTVPQCPEKRGWKGNNVFGLSSKDENNSSGGDCEEGFSTQSLQVRNVLFIIIPWVFHSTECKASLSYDLTTVSDCTVQDQQGGEEQVQEEGRDSANNEREQEDTIIWTGVLLAVNFFHSLCPFLTPPENISNWFILSFKNIQSNRVNVIQAVLISIKIFKNFQGGYYPYVNTYQSYTRFCHFSSFVLFYLFSGKCQKG